MGKHHGRFTWRGIAIGFLTGMLLALVSVLFLRPNTTQRAIDSGDTLAERALEKVLPEVSLENVALTDAAAKIGQMAEVPIIVDLPALEAEKISTYVHVTVRMRNATLATVLDDLTDQIGDADR